jgi:hypothetical protein
VVRPEPDNLRGDGAKGYYARRAVGQTAPVHQEIIKYLYDKNLGTAKKEGILPAA